LGYYFSVESELKDNIEYSVRDIKAKRIEEDKVLVYVELKEDYDPKQGYEEYEFSLPSGKTRKILFELTVVSGIIPIVTSTYSFLDEEKEGMPEVFTKHTDISLWDNQFYLTEVMTSDFIINQVASRVNRKINESENPEAERLEKSYKLLEKPISVKSVDGKFIAGENRTGNTFQLILRFKEGISTTVVPEQIKNLSLLFFVRTLKKYDFYDYAEFEFIGSDGAVLGLWDKKTIEDIDFDSFSWKSLMKIGPTQSY